MGDERRSAKNACSGSVEGGFTIFIDEDRIRAFMEAADFSSASELEHFVGIGAQIESRVRDSGGASMLALSVAGKTLERDFAVLEIAHLLAKNGKSVLIADCDFLHPGMSGLVENIEAHGFLDLLLYGSSLRSVAKSIGIDGVSVAGPGSFPVSRTIPFALKEFGKIRDFLRAKHDIVIYCSTLHTEDGRINPLVPLVDGVIAACRIEDLAEGELEKHITSLGAERASAVEIVCFCSKREDERAAPRAGALGTGESERPHIELRPEPVPEEETVALPPMEEAAGDEPEAHEGRRRPRISLFRVVLIAGAALVVAFIAWWMSVNRTVEQPVPGGDRAAGRAERPSGEARGPAGPPAALGDTAGRTAVRDSAEAGLPEASREIPGSGAQPAAASGTAAEGIDSAAAGAAPGAPAGPAKYTIHVASFTEASRAEAEKKLLESKGFSVRIVEVPLRGDMWLRVFVGAYATMDDAEAARLEVLGLRGHSYARIVGIDRIHE
jgi:septal ring-binding cell division protein DamX